MGAEPVRDKHGRDAADDGAGADAARQKASEAEARAREAEARDAGKARRAEEKGAHAQEKAAARAKRAEEKEAEKARREEEKRLAEEKRREEEAAAQAAREEAARLAAERAVAGVSGSFDTRAVLEEIAKPRLTGSHGAEEVTGTVRACFEALGYEVHDRAFQYNPWPGRFGITAVGVIYFIGTLAAAGFLYANDPFPAIAILLILLVAAGLIALFARPAIDALSFGSQPGLNLLAQRPDSRPRYIVMAHRDSKSQPVPLSFRGPAIVIALLVWLGMLIAAAAHTARPLAPALILALGALGAVAGIILILCWVDNSSPGALDNASGVVAALGLAAREAEAADVAFLITDAEELGLAGSRAAAPHLPPVFGVINLDGLDDDGVFYVLERFGTLRKTGLAPHLAAALLQEADALGEPANRRDLPFGIPVDHIPIVKAGIPALTVMRGSMKSLSRVHRPGDDLDHLRGDGIDRTIALVGGALTRLREQAQALER